MALESGTYISDLVATNPVGATDPKSQGDDHIRLIKATIKASFPNVDGAVTPTPAEFNFLVGVTSAIQDQIAAKADAAAVASALGDKADDDAVVKLTGAQDVAGAKNFTDPTRVASLELGHASDTTLTRIAAGRVAIEGGEVAKLNGTQPFTVEQTFQGAVIRGNAVNIAKVERPGADAGAKRWAFGIGQTGTLQFRTAADDDWASLDNALLLTRDGTAQGSVWLYAANELQLRTQNRAAAPATTGAEVRHADGNLYDVGMNVMPLQAITSSFVIARTHIGKLLAKGESTARTITTPASTDTDVPIGSTVNLVNNGTGAITIEPGSGVTLNRYDGSGAPDTGTHSLAQGGVATLYRAAAATWYVWGNAGLS